jgi:hypothetical protein
MAALRLLALVFKLRRGWKRIPPAQRKKILKTAGKHARKHGPTAAKRIREAVRKAR